MAFRLHHSLVSRAAVSVVVSLWYHEDIDSLKHLNGPAGDDSTRERRPFDNSFFQSYSKKRIHRLALHKRVTNSVSQLFIPESLKRYLLEFVHVIGENLENWIEDHYSQPRKITAIYGQECFAQSFISIVRLLIMRQVERFPSSVNTSIDVDLRKVLRWNPDGEIELEQTGEALVRNEIDSIKRFRLAAAYCREDELLRLWPTVRFHFASPEAWDSNFVYEVSALFWWRYFHSFWPESISSYLFHLESTGSAEGGRIVAELNASWNCRSTRRCSPLTLYLLNTIRQEHVQPVNIIGGAEEIADKRYGAILYRMPESYQVRVFRDFPKSVLKQLLFWRHQSFFTDTVERSWDLFDEDLFETILFHIASGIEKYEDSDIYRSIFRWFWTESPARLRDVERIFYDRRVERGGRTTLREIVAQLFGRPSAAEGRVKRVLFGGRHVLELATVVRAQHVLMDLVRTCSPAEERDEKLEIVRLAFKVRD